MGKESQVYECDTLIEAFYRSGSESYLSLCNQG